MEEENIVNSEMFDFIKKTKPSLIKIISVALKDHDDENGLAGEHIIVKCIVHLPIPKNLEYEEVEKICLVDTHVFKNFVKSKYAIKWM